MDDRILLVPFGLTPDPRSYETWASPRILLTMLKGFLPVDIFRWPHLKSEKPIGYGWEAMAEAFRAQIRPEHHIVDVGTGNPILLQAAATIGARSLITVGFLETVPTLEARGDTAMANVMRLQYDLSEAGAAQVIPLLMQGADEDYLAAAIREVNESIDQTRKNQSPRVSETQGSPIEAGILEIPSLFLDPPLYLDGTFELFKHYAPAARRDTLKGWGTRVHEEDGGRELANKVIPFIQEVIAARG